MKISTTPAPISRQAVATKPQGSENGQSSPDSFSFGSFVKGAVPLYGASQFIKTGVANAIDDNGGRKINGLALGTLANIGGTVALCTGHFGLGAAALLASGICGAVARV